MLNVGLGIWGVLKQNPRHNYDKYILPRFKIRGKYHIGGGFIPTRRPLKSLVGNGIVALGDAAAAVNPIHGGGIGQALLSAELASKVIEEAFEKEILERRLCGVSMSCICESGAIDRRS